jgi:hypothetical protein
MRRDADHNRTLSIPNPRGAVDQRKRNSGEMLPPSFALCATAGMPARLARGESAIMISDGNFRVLHPFMGIWQFSAGIVVAE